MNETESAPSTVYMYIHRITTSPIIHVKLQLQLAGPGALLDVQQDKSKLRPDATPKSIIVFIFIFIVGYIVSFSATLRHILYIINQRNFTSPSFPVYKYVELSVSNGGYYPLLSPRRRPIIRY